MEYKVNTIKNTVIQLVSSGILLGFRERCLEVFHDNVSLVPDFFLTELGEYHGTLVGDILCALSGVLVLLKGELGHRVH